MKSKISKLSPYLMVNDLFEDLSEENKRLNNELTFANNCLNVLNEFKTLLTKIYLKFEANIDSEDKQLFKRLEDDFSSLLKTELNRSESNNGNDLQITGDIKEVTEKAIDLKNETIEENSKKVNLKRHPLLGKRKRSKIGGTRRQRKPRSSEPKPKPTIKEIPKPEDEPNSMLLLKRDNFDPKTSSYVCPNPNCNKSYGSKNNLWLHFYGVHHKQKEYFCDHFNCNKGFKTFNELRAHSITHSEIKPFVCDVKGCDFRSKRRDAVDKHMVTHTDNRPFKCSVCEKCFKTQRGLQLHKKRHKSEPSYVCHFEDCRQSFKTSSELRNHKILIHKLVYKTKIFECDWPGCDFTTRNYESAVERHKLRVHIEERKHKCDKCGKVFKFKDILTRHGLVHKSEPTLKCSVEGCTQFLKNAYQLDKHRKLVHNINNETIYCDWPGCEYQTEYSRNLRAHKMVHIGERRHNCDWPDCDKSFLRKQQLRTHYRVHQNLKPFGCVWPGCQQTFRQTGHLKRHVKNVHQKIPRIA